MCSLCSAYGERPYIRSDFPCGIISAIDLQAFFQIIMKMPAKKKVATKGKGKGKKSKTSQPPPDEVEDQSSVDLPAEDSDTPEGSARSRSQSPSAVPSGSRDTSPASSVSIDASIPTKVTKKRAKRKDCSLNLEEQDQMLDFIRDNPMLWNVKMTDYRNKDKKNKIWADQAELMGRTAENLKGWFRSLRDTHTRLDKKKSGDGAANLTEREQ